MIKKTVKRVTPKPIWRTLQLIKLMSRGKTFSRLCRDIYFVLKKKTPLPTHTVYDANINIMNLDTFHKDGILKFSGDIGPLRDSPVRGICIYYRGGLLNQAELTTDNKRLIFDMTVPPGNYDYPFEFYLEFEDGSRDHLGNLQLSYVLERKEFEKKLAEKSRIIPLPPPEIIFITQGNELTDVYLTAGLQGIYKLNHILSDLGYSSQDIHTILDFGCGSGRLMRGLYADDPGREIYGCDYNETLIKWACKTFPAEVHFIKNELLPPLPLEDEKFDLIYLVSVFTHLPLEYQLKWMSEFRRILKKRKPLIVTLHGMAYLNRFKREMPDVYEKLMKKGFISTEILSNVRYGSNEFFTAHLPEYACKTIFKDWEIKAYFPGGKFRNYLSTFNSMGFSGVQDIYVLTH